MYSFIILAASSFLISLILTPLVRNLFLRWKICDQPGESRRVHSQPIPRIGGIPIGVAYLASFGILMVAGLNGGQLVFQGLPQVWALLPAGGVMFLTGLVDDLWGLKPWQKLIGQLAAALLAYQAGVAIHGIDGYDLPYGLALPVTVVWLMGCANAFNLIDGIDGLAAGVGLFATVTTLIAGLLQNNVELAYATVALAGALAGFIRYNFNPATVFLGDCGSLSIGFLLGCFGVLWSQKSATVLGMTAPLMAMAVPLLDTALAIVRRFLGRKPIFAADRGHIHHRLLDRGLTHRKVALLLYAVCGVGAALSLLANVARNQFAGLVLVLFAAAAWIGIQHLGYVEFGTAGRMFLDGAFRHNLAAHIALDAFRDCLKSAQTPADCWQAVRSSFRQFGYTHAELDLGGNCWEEPVLGDLGGAWSVFIPLSDNDHLGLMRDFSCTDQPVLAAAFADSAARLLRAKVAEMPVAERYEPKAMTAGAGRAD